MAKKLKVYEVEVVQPYPNYFERSVYTVDAHSKGQAARLAVKKHRHYFGSTLTAEVFREES